MNFLSVIPPHKFEREYTEKLIQKMTQKRGVFRKNPLEDITDEAMVWMPYYRVQFNYTRSGKSSAQNYRRTGQAETALNAMLCGSVTSEREFSMLFRPNYLGLKTTSYLPQPEEIVGLTVQTDLDKVLNRLLKRLNSVTQELYKLRSTLTKSRLRSRRYSMILPLRRELKQKEEELSKKVAELNATKSILSMSLNVNADLDSIKVTDHSVFYYPTLIVAFKHKQNGTVRYLIINLAGNGSNMKNLSCDIGLTNLANRNSACKEVIARLLVSTSSAN